ncbi:MAG: DNA cytosine methyltransferase [Rhodoferax sp.]
MHSTNTHTPTFLDLFSGCGGFSVGLEQAGLKCLAGVDFNQQAINTFRENHSSDTVALVKDMTIFKPTELAELIGTDHVDFIVGGPPCQGFSTARQFSGSNSGDRLVDDPRRELYKFFLKFVDHFRPKVFVMENVLGVKKVQNGIYFTAIQNEARKFGYRVVPIEVKTWEYGVPQKRVRQLFIGTLIDLPIFDHETLIRKTHGIDPSIPELLPIVTLGEAIEDLPILQAGDERIQQDYDMSLRKKYLAKYSGGFLNDVLQVAGAQKLTWHCARPHSARDLRDFARLNEGETCGRAIARGVEMEFPYDRSSFKDRYTRQSRSQLCSTIVAHLKSDGLMFIHPTQTRSLTPREAARVQTFPDTFNFTGSRSHAFTQIGNAVPPLVGRAVGKGVLNYLVQSKKATIKTKLSASQKSKYLNDLEEFINECHIRPLDFVEDEKFLVVWKYVHALLPHLHPESCLDNGNEISAVPKRDISFCIEPYFTRSGWPVELVAVAQEARKRYLSKRLTSEEYYHA